MSKETDIHFAPSTAAASPRSQPGSPSASGNRRALSSASGGGFRRSIDGARPGRTASMLRKSKSTGAKSALAQRSPPVSSDMYPIVSSDLDLEREEEARYGGRLGGGRSAPSSPPGTPTLRDVPGTSAPGSPQTKMAIGSPIPRKDMRSFAPSSPSPARKRVVDKGMIGLPTNFQVSTRSGPQGRLYARGLLRRAAANRLRRPRGHPI